MIWCATGSLYLAWWCQRSFLAVVTAILIDWFILESSEQLFAYDKQVYAEDNRSADLYLHTLSLHCEGLNWMPRNIFSGTSGEKKKRQSAHSTRNYYFFFFFCLLGSNFDFHFFSKMKIGVGGEKIHSHFPFFFRFFCFLCFNFDLHSNSTTTAYFGRLLLHVAWSWLAL